MDPSTSSVTGFSHSYGTEGCDSHNKRAVRPSTQKAREKLRVVLAPPKVSRKRKRGEGGQECRLSNIEAVNGAGQGLFAVAKAKGTVAFIKGETVLKKVEGCLALRVTLENSLSVEWLYSNGSIHGLRDSAYVIWSGLHCNIGTKKPRIEPGLKPDDLSIFSNDSCRKSEANIELKVAYATKDFPPDSTTTIDPSCPPFQISMKAKRDINDGEELCWHYGRSQPQESNFASNYLEPFDPEKHENDVRSWTKALIPTDSSQVPLELIRDEQTFDERRWLQNLKSELPPPVYSEQEESYKKLLEAGEAKETKQVLSHVKDNSDAGNAYIKYHIHRRQASLSEALSTINRTLTRNNWNELSDTDFYDYCINQGLLNPEVNISSVPLPWIARKLAAEHGNFYYLTLLQKRLRASISSPDFRPHTIINNLNRAEVPNPFKEYKCEWGFSDLLSIAQHAGNMPRDPEKIKKIIDEYYKEGYDIFTSNAVSKLAQLGNIDAVLAILKKRLLLLEIRQTLKQVSDSFIKNGTMIPIKSKMSEATKENLIVFIRERFSLEDRAVIFPTADANQEELALKLTEQKAGSSLSKTTKEKIATCKTQEERIDLFKNYLRNMGLSSRKSDRYDFMKNARIMAAHISELPNPLEAEDIVELFSGSDKTWLERFLVEAYDNEKLLELLSIPDHHSHKKFLEELLKRGKADASLRGDIILKNKKASKIDDRQFFYKMATVYQNKGYQPPSGERWSVNDIRSLYQASAEKHGILTDTLHSKKTAEEWIAAIKKQKGLKSKLTKTYKDKLASARSEEEQSGLIREYIDIYHAVEPITTSVKLMLRLQDFIIPGVKSPHQLAEVIAFLNPSGSAPQWLNSLQ